MSLLGLDMGTSSCKAAIFDESGVMLARASKKYSAYVPRPGWCEMDPEAFYEAAVNAIREVSSLAAEPVQAISISSHGETFIPVDHDYIPVGPAVMNSDNRALEEVRYLDDRIGKERIFSITGDILHPMYSLPKIMWYISHSEMGEKTARYLSVGDYVLSCFGLIPVTDYSSASRTLAFDVKMRKWSDDMLSAAGVKESMFSEVVPAGTAAGKIQSGMADKLGIPVGTVVAVGGHDQPVGSLGAGIMNEDNAMDSAGSYECLAITSDKPLLTDEAFSYSLNSYCHVIPGKYITLAFFSAGIAFQWVCEQLSGVDINKAEESGKSVYELLIEKLPSGPTGICFTPHFVGSGNPSWNVNATGALVGLRPDHTRYHIVKSILEGIACEIGINIAVLEKLTGTIDVLRTTGGGAKSTSLLQMRADITGKKIMTLKSSESVCLGAAILAGVSAGVYKDAEDGARQTVSVAETYNPDDEMMNAYKDQVIRYRQLYPALHAGGLY